MAKCEQADGDSRRKNGYHQFLKRKKVRLERKKAKQMLKRGEQPLDEYGAYQGYET